MVDPDGERGRRLRLLTQCLAALAAGAADQRAWVDRYDVPTDELALDFEHAHRLVAGNHLGDDEVMADLRAIDAVLSAMSGPGNAPRWSQDALDGDPGWTEIRERARRALIRLTGGWRLPLPELRVVR
ncbi:hypothetical protein [Kitasatospora sp. NPDC097643]|uniref:hypothetical protein n=1 Tax=Kitasatospora sp. NPDC097643 TaxID=3157230 RepID=UPI00331E1262